MIKGHTLHDFNTFKFTETYLNALHMIDLLNAPYAFERKIHSDIVLQILIMSSWLIPLLKFAIFLNTCYINY